MAILTDDRRTSPFASYRTRSVSSTRSHTSAGPDPYSGYLCLVVRWPMTLEMVDGSSRPDSVHVG